MFGGGTRGELKKCAPVAVVSCGRDKWTKSQKTSRNEIKTVKNSYAYNTNFEYAVHLPETEIPTEGSFEKFVKSQ